VRQVAPMELLAALLGLLVMVGVLLVVDHLHGA
jgi:hypothetical protein